MQLVSDCQDNTSKGSSAATEDNHNNPAQQSHRFGAAFLPCSALIPENSGFIPLFFPEPVTQVAAQLCPGRAEFQCLQKRLQRFLSLPCLFLAPRHIPQGFNTVFPPALSRIHNFSKSHWLPARTMIHQFSSIIKLVPGAQHLSRGNFLLIDSKVSVSITGTVFSVGNRCISINNFPTRRNAFVNHSFPPEIFFPPDEPFPIIG